MAEFKVLKPTDNCWRIEQAKRVAFLVDGDAYFRALYEAIKEARYSIFILAWDIDSRVRLVRDDVKDDAMPYQLGAFLDAAVKQRKGLNAFVLNWDWAMIYSLERELLPLYKLEWKTHRRVHFQLDNECPAEGSHHQKVVVIDDTIAFVGGIDLGKHRWDTSAHQPDDHRRTDPEGKQYPPFHDVQMLVEGDVATALGDLFRERWLAATGQQLGSETKQESSKKLWPVHVDAAITDVNIAIARTKPAYKKLGEVREVECLYLDMIAAAKRYIYIENQYFSSWKIADALSKRLQERDGPEVVLVQPLMTGGWLEQNTMDVLRSRLLKQLREADQHDCLRVYYPDLDGLGSEHISLHSKIMVVDDTLLRVGSSNLSNRSMGLDSECDLAIEATVNDQHAAVNTFRNRLLAEHLGVEPAKVDERLSEKQSLIATIESLQGNSRTFKPLDGHVSELADKVLPDEQIVDPERPLEPEQLTELLLPIEEPRSTSDHMLSTAIILGILTALVGAWHWTPLGDWLSLEMLTQSAEWLRQSIYAPVIVIGIYLISGVVAIPVILLIIVTVIIFGPWIGFAYALIGAELSVFLGYWAGRLLGRKVIRWFANDKINRLSRILARRNLKSIITVRIIPIASFTATNMIMGANHVLFRELALGSLLGMIPGILAVALFADRLANLLHAPSLFSFFLLVFVVIMIAMVAIGLKKWLSK